MNKMSGKEDSEPCEASESSERENKNDISSGSESDGEEPKEVPQAPITADMTSLDIVDNEEDDDEENGVNTIHEPLTLSKETEDDVNDEQEMEEHDVNLEVDDVEDTSKTYGSGTAIPIKRKKRHYGPRFFIHTFMQVCMIIFVCCPLCLHVLFSILGQGLWYVSLTIEGETIWYNVLSGLQYTVGMIIFVAIQLCICVFVCCIRRCHVIVTCVVYSYACVNVAFMLYALYVTINSPIAERWPNFGEWTMLLMNWGIGVCAFTGFLTSCLYCLSRPKWRCIIC